MVTAAAPISEDVIEMLKIASCSPILEGYGQTESTGGSFLTYVNDPDSGHVGGPGVSTEFKVNLNFTIHKSNFFRNYKNNYFKNVFIKIFRKF